MSLTIKSKSETITTKRQLQNFTITTPPGKESSLVASYTEADVDSDGNVRYERPSIATLGLTQDKLIELLPKDNKYGLPAFADLYKGLKAFFDDQFVVNFPRLAVDNYVEPVKEKVVAEEKPE